MSSELFTREQVDIELIKQKTDSFYTLMGDVKSELRELRGYIIGIYAVIGAAALARICGIL